MKLIKCYIENFGKLHQFSYEFKDGLNTIVEENGFGKTTFATFIKSMLYGLDPSNKTEKSDRKKYKPWQGGTFGGNLEIEVDEKKYRIERFFGTKSSEDTFALYNLETNLKSNDYTDNIGEEIFKINKDGYERSTYIPQGQIQINMEDSLAAKLGNILESENDVNSSDEAIKLLSENIKIYKKNGNRGLLNEKIEKLSELNRALENAKFDEENLKNRKKIQEEKIKQIGEQEKLKKQKQQILSEKIEHERKLAKKETYSNILKKFNEAEQKQKELRDFFKEDIPEDTDIEKFTSKCIEIEKLKTEIENCRINGRRK